MDDFLILLQAKLDEAALKGVKGDLDGLRKEFEKLKIKPVIDEKALSDLSAKINKLFVDNKISISDININTANIVKDVQKSGKQIGNTFKENISDSLKTVKGEIANTVKEMSRLDAKKIIGELNLNRSSVENGVVSEVKLLVSEINNLGHEAAKTNSDSAWEQLIAKCNRLGEISKSFGKIRELPNKEDITRFADYFNGKTLSVGYRNSGLSGTDFTATQLSKDLKELGVKFSSTKQDSIELNSIWEEMCQTTGRMDLLNISNAQDQIQTVVSELMKAQSLLYGEKSLSPHPESTAYISQYLQEVETTRNTVKNLEQEKISLMQKESQSSTSATNTIVQNEEKKQQALQQTANIQRRISESESLIKSGANVTTFEHTNNAAREASEYFKQLLQDENAVISVSERFGELNGLTSFTVNVKRATGEVESLRYSLEEIKDANGNGTGDFLFTNKGGELNNANAIKQIQAIENAFADYTAKLAQFKSTNSEILSGLSTPISDFESKLAGLKNGTSTISEVANSFKSLNTEASNITANFSRQLSPIDSAIRNLAKGEETIASLRAEIKGLNNAPKEINTELNKCSSLLAKVKQIESENGRTSEWSQAYKEWANVVDALKAKLTTLRKEQSNVASTQIFKISDLKSNDIAYMSKVYNTIEKQMSEINKMANAKGWNIVDVSGVEQADGKIKQLTLTVQDAEGALKRLTMQREKLQGNGKAQFGLMQVGDVKVIETAAQAQEKLAQNAEKANAKLAEQVNKIQLLSGGGIDNDYDTQLKKLEGSFTRIGLKKEEIVNKMSGVKSALSDLRDRLAQPFDESNYDEIIALNQKLQTELSNVRNESVRMNATMKMATDSSRLNNVNQMQRWADNNSKAMKKYGVRINEIIAKMGDLNTVMSKADASKLLNEFKSMQKEASKAGIAGMTAIDKIKKTVEKFGGWSMVTGSVTTLWHQLQRIPKEVYEIDTAMTNLYKVTDETGRKYNQFLESAGRSAQELGRSISSLVEQTANWAKLGFDIDTAAKLAEISSIYANVGEVDDATAVSDLVTAMKSFNIEASNAMTIVDSLNKLGNEFATDAKSLGEGLKNSASSMAVAGNDINQTLAILTGAGEITQNVGELSNGLRVVSMRLRGMKGELQSIGEEYEDIESISKIQTQIYNLTNGRVNIFKDDGSLKSTYDQLKEVSEVYFELSDADRANLTEIMFGKNRANQGIAILQAFQSGQIQKAYEASVNSAGSAMQEQERWLESLEAKTQQFEAAFQSLSSTILDSDLLKWFVDFGTVGISSIEDIIRFLENVNTLGGNISGTFGNIGAISGLLMNKAGIGECTKFQW